MIHLPIHDSLDQIKHTLKNHNRLILQAPPGAGKSTIVPISLLKEPWLGDKMIIMLEPRRVAARMVATQMAKLLGEEIGQSVGYQIKMERCTSSKTKILVVTEAILVRKLQSNQTIDDVAMVIFDEFHERSIHTDLSLALSLQVQELLRDDLKLLLMSATLNTQTLSTLLHPVPIIHSEGRLYDVEKIYLDIHTKQPDRHSLNALLQQTTLRAIKENDGDILVFLPGVKETKNLQKSLSNHSLAKNIAIFPLYSTLSKKEQEQAIHKHIKRKIILSTNIAQTSLTIEGVSIVIDSGLEKQSRYNYATAMDNLELSFISQDAATQRAGRAGRMSHGKCYRLWHASKILQESTPPEILRADITALLLDVALWGVTDLNELQFLDIPKETIIHKTQLLLQELHMLGNTFHITPFGKNALRLGVHPRVAFMILKANDLGFAHEATLLASLLQEQDIFIHSQRESDLALRFTHLYEKDFANENINSYRAKEVLRGATLLVKKLQKIQEIQKKSLPFTQEMLGVLLLFAYPDRLAHRRMQNDNRYLLSNAKGALLHREDSLFHQEFLVVANLNTHEKNSHIHSALSITFDDIEKYFSPFLQAKESITYNKTNKKFEIRENTYFLQLQLSSKLSKNLHKKDFTKLLIDLLQQEGLALLTWSKKALSLKNRVNFLHHHEQFVDFSDDALLHTIEEWLQPYLLGITTVKELEALNIYTILLSLLSWEQQEYLDKMVPQSLKVPSGSKINVDYNKYDKPLLRVKIQEIFGLHETPQVLNNSLSLQLHLLTPAMTPIQITYDLKSFWKNSYAEVRKELRGKYKRHYWPENPYEAIATKKTKKYMTKKTVI